MSKAAGSQSEGKESSKKGDSILKSIPFWAAVAVVLLLIALIVVGKKGGASATNPASAAVPSDEAASLRKEIEALKAAAGASSTSATQPARKPVVDLTPRVTAESDDPIVLREVPGQKVRLQLDPSSWTSKIDVTTDEIRQVGLGLTPHNGVTVRVKVKGQQAKDLPVQPGQSIETNGLEWIQFLGNDAEEVATVRLK